MTIDLLGDSVPKPLGFSALRNQKGQVKRQSSEALPLRHPPPRRSGRSPALPYPPGGQNHHIMEFKGVKGGYKQMK